MTRGWLPADYEHVSPAGVSAFAWAGAVGWLETALAESGTLHGWAGRQAVDDRSGRGPLYVIDAPVAGPDGAARWAVRHYRRGGAAAKLLGDRYWGAGRSRPELELQASLLARAHGVRTPAVIAGAVYRRGPAGGLGFYRADLVTELVPCARSLAEVLLGGGDPLSSLRKAGALVKELQQANLLHADLNAGNIVLDEAGQVWALDLDRARRLAARKGKGGARAMIRRLERSLRRLERAHARPLSAAEWAALHAGLREGA